MTVSYNLDVSSVGIFTFLKLLGKWKGSIFKSVLWELIGWNILYFSIHLIYRFSLTENQQKTFEKLAIHLDGRLAFIPLTFMLGFFVTIVIDRWRKILSNVSFIESCALTIGVLIRGVEEKPKLVRRNIVRYLVLSQVLVFRDISMKVRRRFPNLESLIDAGFLFQDELDMINNYKIDYNKYWMPINWANSLILRSSFDKFYSENKLIEQPASLNLLLLSVNEFRMNLDTIVKYDWVPIPIAYPQVVFLAVRVYFLICLVSRQFFVHQHSDRVQINLVLPIMTILEFLFFFGWMKVAEALLNPLGEDDDDLECNWLIDKNITTAMAIVDDHYDNPPPLKLDAFADPSWKPLYSEDTVDEERMNQACSVANVELTGCHERVKMVSVDRQTEIIHKSSDTETSLRRKLTTVFHNRQRANSIQPLSFSDAENKKFSDAASTKNKTNKALASVQAFSSLSRLDEEIDRASEKRNE